MEHRYISHGEWRAKSSQVSRFGLARQPTLNFPAFDCEVLRWVEDTASVNRLVAAIGSGVYGPGAAMNSASVWQMAIQFDDGSEGWVELIGVGRNLDGCLYFGGPSCGLVELPPDLRALLEDVYGWNALEQVIDDVLAAERERATPQ